MGKVSIGSSRTPSVKPKLPDATVRKPEDNIISGKLINKETSSNLITSLQKLRDENLDKPKAMKLQEPKIEHHHHTKHVTVHMETIKTKDLRTRSYAKAVRKESQTMDNQILRAVAKNLELISTLDQKLDEVASRKPMENQVVTEIKTETKVIEYKLDKRVIIAMVITTVLNLALVLLK